MIAALIVTNASWLALALAAFIFARFGVVSLHVRRPPKPRNPKTETSP